MNDLLHGKPCLACKGEGHVGPTADTCEFCQGKGAFLDDKSCWKCGKPVYYGVDEHGWEVHFHCVDIQPKRVEP